MRERDGVLEDKDRLYEGLHEAMRRGYLRRSEWLCYSRKELSSWGLLEGDTMYRTVSKRQFYFHDVWNVDLEHITVEGFFYWRVCYCCGSPVRFDRVCVPIL